jgi:hypothetical protein
MFDRVQESIVFDILDRPYVALVRLRQERGAIDVTGRSF